MSNATQETVLPPAAAEAPPLAPAVTREKAAPRILIVDDNRSIHEDITKILMPVTGAADLDAAEAALFGSAAPTAQRTYELDHAYQGQEADEKVARAVAEGRHYAMAFVDMRMPPGWDGVQTIERLWQKDPDLQVVICSAYSDYSWEQIIEKLGVSDRLLILKKPAENVEVCQLACSLTEKWELTRRARMKLEELNAMVQERTGELSEMNQKLMAEIAERQRTEEALRESEARFRHDALHDRLTGLANRALLLDRMELAVQRWRRHPKELCAVLFLDLDRFKLINDSLGHAAGDELLMTVAGRLTGCVRALDTVGRKDSDHVSRLGGDEFVLLLDWIRDPSDAARVAERLLTALAQPIVLCGQEVSVSASIGIAVCQPQHNTADELLRDADAALYRAKSAGKGRYEVFNSEMHANAVASLEIENDLRRALERNELRVHYQPIVGLKDGRIRSFEALVRWQHPQRGQVSPAEFIPLAEETGLIVPIGQWVMTEACRQCAGWQRLGGVAGPVSVSVNLAGQQTAQQDFAAKVRAALDETRLDSQLLQLEITETAIIASGAASERNLARLREMDVRLHLDDFGTGYNSFAYLQMFPIDTLKVDRSFVSRMERNKGNAAIVEAIIRLGHALNLTVVAEGIETPAELACLLAMGCDAGQGYLFARPMPAEDAIKILQARPSLLPVTTAA